MTTPSFAEAVRFWFWLGCVSFGGPAAQIAIMHRELVERRRWVGETEFQHGLNFCVLLPGPEAQQLATYLGWRLHGWRGALAGGALFFLPAAVLLWGLAWLYMTLGHLPVVNGVLSGLKPAVVALIVAALWRMGRRALRSGTLRALALAAFVASLAAVSFPLIVAAALAVGFCAATRWPGQFPTGHAAGAAADVSGKSSGATFGRSLRTAAVWGAVWWLPLLGLGAWLGWGSRWFEMGVFFSKAAMVTFGGAYAVLPYVGAHAVAGGWLSQAQMLDGLALAETTPGPLIMVLQFVGFVAGWRTQAGLSPLAAATLGAAVTTWATFVPSFLYILSAGPWVERAGRVPRLSAGLAAVTAAVVGVIGAFAWQLGGAVFFPAGGFAWQPTVLSAVCVVALVRWQLATIWVLAGAAVCGWVVGW